jgi:chromosome segregation ATPase
VLDKKGLVLLDPRKAGELGACPVEGAAGRLTVAVAEPTEGRVASVRAATGCDPLLVVVTPATLERLHDEADAAEHGNEEGRTISAAAVERAGDDDADGLDQVEVALAAATRQVAAVRDHVSRLLSANAAAEHDHDRLQTEVETTREALAALERERQADRDAALQAKAAVEAALSERDARQAALEATCSTLQNQLRSLRSLVDQMNRILD